MRGDPATSRKTLTDAAENVETVGTPEKSTPVGERVDTVRRCMAEAARGRVSAMDRSGRARLTSSMSCVHLAAKASATARPQGCYHVCIAFDM
jgi:hypothetical protein